jgi:hypothetical protein
LAATDFSARGFLVRGFTAFALTVASVFAEAFGALLVVTVFLQILMCHALTRNKQAAIAQFYTASQPKNNTVRDKVTRTHP